jgi:hypothetical protein
MQPDAEGNSRQDPAGAAAGPAIVAEHRRSFGRGQTVYDPRHYVPVLARKPGALRNGARFKNWLLPGALERIRRKLATADDGDRQMVDILGAVLTDGLGAVEAGCAEALSAELHSSDVILNILARRRDVSAAISVLAPEALPAASRAHRRLGPIRQSATSGLMERHQIIEMMLELKLAGMRGAFGEILANGLKRQHSVPQILGDLLQSEIAEKQARSIKYQVAIARLPLAKELSEFDFSGTPINQGPVRDLATGSFLQNQRNAVLVGRRYRHWKKPSCRSHCPRLHPRRRARGRFHTAVNLVNRLEAEARAGRERRIADRLTRLDFLIPDELGYLPFAL